MARIFRRLDQLNDVDTTGVADGDALVYDDATDTWIPGAGGGGGAPTDATYLVTTANGDLSAEVVVGATPGGELGGTWASPTVDATHSGSSHAQVQAAAEATAAADVDAHEADTTNVHGITNTANLLASGSAAGGVLGGTYPNPSFAADMATQTELDAHINDSSAAHAASAISASSATLSGTGTDVQAVLEELDNLLDDHSARHENGGADEISIAGLDGTPTELTNHLGDTSDAHDASAISVLDTAAVFTATDVEAALLELYNRLPRELAYVEFTAPVSVTSTTEAGANSVVSAGAVTFDGSTRVKIEFYSPIVLAGSTAGSYTILTLWDGSTDLGRIAAVGHSLLVTTVEVPVKVERFLTPSNASHTYSIRAWRVASDGTVSAGSGGTAAQLPGFIRITKA